MMIEEIGLDPTENLHSILIDMVITTITNPSIYVGDWLECLEDLETLLLFALLQSCKTYAYRGITL